MPEQIPATNEELMREFFDTNSLAETVPPEEWMAAETEDDDQEPEQDEEPDPGDGISEAERAFIGASEWQAHLHPRGEDGKFVKKFGMGGKSRFFPATRVRTKYASWDDDEWEEGWTVGSPLPGMVSILYPGKGVMNHSAEKIDDGSFLVEPLTDGPVYLSDIALIYKSKLEPWQPREKRPDLEVPSIPDEFWAKEFKKRTKDRQFPAMPLSRPVTDDEQTEMRDRVLSDPSSYEFQWLKQSRDPFTREINDEIAMIWAQKWLDENTDPAEREDYRYEGYLSQATKRMPDFTAEISPEIYEYLWGLLINNRDIRKPENRELPGSPDHPWLDLVPEEMSFQKARDQVEKDTADPGWGNLRDTDVSVDLGEKIKKELGPLLPANGRAGWDIFPGRWNFKWDRDSWDPDQKRFTRVIWQQHEPNQVLAIKWVDKGADANSYWYQRRTGNTKTLDVVPSERAIKQESLTTEFGRIVFGVLEQYVNGDPRTEEIQVDIVDLERQFGVLHDGLRAAQIQKNVDEYEAEQWFSTAIHQIALDSYEEMPVAWRYNRPPDGDWSVERLLQETADWGDELRFAIRSHIPLVVLERTRRIEAASQPLNDLTAKLADIARLREDKIQALDAVKRDAYLKMMREQFSMEMGADREWPLDLTVEREDAESPAEARRMIAIQEAGKALPARWVEASNRAGFVEMLSESTSAGGDYGGRGYHTWDGSRGRSEIWLPEEDRLEHVAVHELAHRMERVIPGLPAMEAAFHYRRTRGDDVRRYGLSETEWLKPDKFTDEYSGKMYDGDSWEIFTMAMQSLYPYLSKEEDYRQWSVDPEFLSFALGMLTLR